MSSKQQNSSIFYQITNNYPMRKRHSHNKGTGLEKQKYKLHNSFDIHSSKKQSSCQIMSPQSQQYLQKSNSQLVIENAKGHKGSLMIFQGWISCVQLNRTDCQINSKLEENDFPILRFSLGQLVKFSAQIMHRNQFSKQRIPLKLLHKAICKIQTGYQHIPYHNFSHAFSLMQLFNVCVKQSPRLSALLTSEDHFYACLAGLAHDLGHKGTNNNFQIKSKSKLAQDYRNEAVLQKMHIQRFFALMEQSEETNLLRFSSDITRTKKLMTDLILATDMSRHVPDLKSLQLLRLERSDLSPANVSKNDKQFIVQQVFHACDLGNSTQCFESYIEWVALLSIEFSGQYRLEQQMGLEISKGMKWQNRVDLYNDQLWFLSNMVLPLWKQLCTMEFAPVQLVLNVKKNLERVNQSKEEEFRQLKS